MKSLIALLALAMGSAVYAEEPAYVWPTTPDAVRYSLASSSTQPDQRAAMARSIEFLRHDQISDTEYRLLMAALYLSIAVSDDQLESWIVAECTDLQRRSGWTNPIATRFEDLIKREPLAAVELPKPDGSTLRGYTLVRLGLSKTDDFLKKHWEDEAREVFMQKIYPAGDAAMAELKRQGDELRQRVDWPKAKTRLPK